MTARNTRFAVAATVVLLLGLLSAPLVAAGDEKTEKPNSALVVEGWEIVGTKVLVKVTNLGNTRASGVLEVRALVVGVPVRRTADVTVVGEGSTWVPVVFGLPVGGVLETWIVDGAEPVG